MESAERLSRNQHITEELQQAIERMSARLTYQTEPSVTFSLKQPSNAETAEPAEPAE
jgi:hypothetical protein